MAPDFDAPLDEFKFDLLELKLHHAAFVGTLPGFQGLGE
jgi:hypothetical protein